jgi:hypothetical protein
VFDFFGVVFDGHPDLRRIEMPRTGSATRCARTSRWPAWHAYKGAFIPPPISEGLRMADPARDGRTRREPIGPGATAQALSEETMIINMGPQHPSTHGVLRLVLELDGEYVVSCGP